jgi:hypothetical protein
MARTKKTKVPQDKQLTTVQAARWEAILLIVLRLWNAAVAAIAPGWRLVPETGINSIIVEATSAAALRQDKDKSKQIVRGAGYKIILPPTLLDDPEKANTSTREVSRNQVTLCVATDVQDNVAAARRILGALIDLFKVYNRDQEKLTETLAAVMAELQLVTVPNGKTFEVHITKAATESLATATESLGAWPVGAVRYKVKRKADGNRHGVLLQCAGDNKRKTPCEEIPEGGGRKTVYSLGRFNREDNIRMLLEDYDVRCPHCKGKLTYDASKLADDRIRTVVEVEVNG